MGYSGESMLVRIAIFNLQTESSELREVVTSHLDH